MAIFELILYCSLGNSIDWSYFFCIVFFFFLVFISRVRLTHDSSFFILRFFRKVKSTNRSNERTRVDFLSYEYIYTYPTYIIMANRMNMNIPNRYSPSLHIKVSISMSARAHAYFRQRSQWFFFLCVQNTKGFFFFYFPYQKWMKK